MRNRIVKVYGHLRPCLPEWLGPMQGSLGILGEEADGVLHISGELLNISYEGVYFPIEDFLQALAPLLDSASQGKVDYMDMDAWRLTRYSFDNGFITKSERDLNSVLDYSGH